MSSKKEIRWLYDELPELISKGIISEETSDQLKEHYGPIEPQTNLSIGFFPLIVAQIIYGYAFFKKRDVIAWAESSVSFLMLMLLCTLALISQIYNLGGELRDPAFVEKHFIVRN